MILKGKGDELKHKRWIGTGRRDRRKETWKRTVKHGAMLRGWQACQRCSTDICVPKGRDGSAATTTTASATTTTFPFNGGGGGGGGGSSSSSSSRSRSNVPVSFLKRTVCSVLLQYAFHE